MKRMLKISILATILLWWLNSCSSAWHLQKAIIKNPNIIQTKIDTVTIIGPGETKIVHAKDSIIINEPGVYISVHTKGDSLVLFYDFLPDTLRIIEKQTVFNIPKSRQEIRLNAKSERVKTRVEGKTQRTAIRKNEHTKRVDKRVTGRNDRQEKRIDHRSKNLFIKYTFFLLIGMLIGFIACLFLVKRFSTTAN